MRKKRKSSEVWTTRSELLEECGDKNPDHADGEQNNDNDGESAFHFFTITKK